MKALLALLLACPASAAVSARAVTRPSAPVVAPAPSLSAPGTLSVPALAPAAFAAPTLSPSPALAPAAAAPAAAPQISAQAQIESVGAAVAPKEGASAPEAALSSAFDGGSTPKADAPAVSALAQSHAAAELSLSRAHAARFEKPVERSWRARAWETGELAMTSLPFHIGAALSSYWVPEAWSGAGQAAVWTAAGAALVHHLRGLRSTVVGGWQASHDQKYRVGYDGRIRDVRGQKYGSDRYEEYAPGAVSRRERLVVYAAMMLSAVPWLSGLGWASAGSFMGLAGLGVLVAMRRRG